MSPATRTTYFRHWAAACAVQGWNPSDNDRRHAVTLHAMQEIGAGDIASITALDHHQVTALLTFLRFLAGDGKAEPTHLWARCKQDYIAFNQLRQAEHFRRKAGYKQTGKLGRQRFGLNFPEEEIAQHTMTSKEVRQYLITHANRARKKSQAPAENCPF